MVELTEAEGRVLIMELDHGPDCAVYETNRPYWVDSAGKEWADPFHTTPRKPVRCNCGYFDLMYTAREKVATALGIPISPRPDYKT